MKKTSIIVTSFIVLSISFILMNSCQTNYTEKEFLSKVSDKLSSIKTATYYTTGTASAPGDTTKFSEPRTQYIKLFTNPSDTFVGASFALYAKDDTTRITDFYDGKARAWFNWEKKIVMVDSFQSQPYPFRLVYYSLYTKVNEIIKYSLTTQDSIKTDFIDYGDSIRFSLKIYNKHVYFHIKPIVIKNEYIPEDEISQFDILFLKKDYLPYRMRSKWYHTAFFEDCTAAKFNTSQEETFVSTDYIPEDFEIIQYKRKERNPESDLVGKTAPDWVLKDTENNTIGLKDLKSKVIMIQFTGIGCGPCHSSIPFLKQLVVENRDKDFEFLSIETWSKNIDGMIRYIDRNKMNYKLLLSNKDVNKNYQVQSVPVFFILDENRVIRNIINGYGASVDKQIRDAINELI